MQALIRFWNSGVGGKVIVVGAGGLLAVCWVAVILTVLRTRFPGAAPTPTLIVLPTLASTAQPTAMPPSATVTVTSTTPPPTRTPTDLPTSTGTPSETPTSTLTNTPAAANGDTRVRSVDGMVMVYVTAGEFMMGSTDDEIASALKLGRKSYGSTATEEWFEIEAPMHTVTLDAFWLDQTEVTMSQYRHCIETGNCTSPSKNPNFDTAGYDEHPVVGVTWHQARTYCAWAGVRLPTEAEWEYAARGSERRAYPWGNAFDGRRLNYCDSNCADLLDWRDEAVDDGYPFTSPVRNYPGGMSWSKAHGLAGNATEWTADWSGPYSPENQLNPQGAPSGDRRVARGGSWQSDISVTRSAFRVFWPPDTTISYLGFRCAQTAR